jgi:diguanylate cyclase (GGDEF)-like protein
MDALPIRRTDEIGVLARCFARMRREIKSQIDVLHTKQSELSHLASHDVLTDLPNRMLFMEQLEAAIGQASENADRLAVLFVDLDRFKQINDQFGHSAGDNVLIAVARRLRDVLWPDDLVARLGGDEFVVLIEDLDSANVAERIARKLIDKLAEGIALPEGCIAVTTSIGIAYRADAVKTGDELMKLADDALYAAKAGGRNTFRVAQ